MVDKIKRFISHPLFSGSFLMFAGGMAVNVLNYVYHLLMGRMLGPVDYGVLASVFSVIYVASIVPMSSSFAIVKFISDAKSDSERTKVYVSMRRFLLKLAIGAFIILTILSPLIKEFLHIENIWSVLFVGPLIFLSLNTLVNQASMQGILKFIGLVGPNLISSVGKLVFGILLVLIGFSVPGAIAGVFLAQILAYWLSEVLKGKNFGEKTKSDFDLRPFLKYALPVLLQALAFTAFFTIDLIMAKHFLPAFEAGLYAAISMLGKIIYFATSPITATMFPIVAGKRSRGEKYRTVFLMAFVATICVSLGVVLFYWLFPSLTIGLLYGKEYLSVTKELVWMGLFMAFYTASHIVVNFLLSINRIRVVVIPILGVGLQVVLILFRHGTILQIVRSSLIAIIFVFVGVSLSLGYEEYSRIKRSVVK